MHDIQTRTAELHAPASGHERWSRRGFHDAAGRDQLHRIGLPFAEVGIRQSATPHLQAKLTVSHPGDRAEQEADRVADAVMHDEIERAVANDTEDEEIGRSVDGAVSQDEEEVLAASRAGGVPAITPALEAEIQRVRGSGAPLTPDTRAFFEPRLGADLSNVRVSTGNHASSVARQLNARAFTVGNHITFGAGQYQPSSNDGKRLIAHELTHVIQQGGAPALPHPDASER